MDVFEAIKKRRAVKHYDPNHTLTEEEVNQMMSAAMLSPTSFNIQNWRFVLVRDQEIRKQLRVAAWDQAQVTEASLLVVLCADLKSWNKEPSRYWKNAPKNVSDMLVPLITKFYKDHTQIQQDEAMRSCGIAAQTLMLAAKAMGYDTCPMVGFDAEKVAKIINLPKDHVVAMFITVGKSIKDAWPRAGQLPAEEVIIYDSF